MNRITDEAALSHILRTLGKRVVAAIRLCIARDYHETRSLPDILATAREAGVRPPVVAAALGFLPRANGRYADTWADNSECEPDELGTLPRRGPVMLAFSLSRALHRDGGAFIAD